MEINQQHIPDADGKEHLYTFKAVDAETGLKLQVKLARILGTPLSKAVASVVQSLGDDVDLKDAVNLDVSAFAKQVIPELEAVVAELARNLGNDDEVLWVVKTLLAPCKRDAKPINFGVDYRKNYLEMWKAVGYALQENFGPLLGGLRIGGSGSGRTATEPT